MSLMIGLPVQFFFRTSYNSWHLSADGVATGARAKCSDTTASRTTSMVDGEMNHNIGYMDGRTEEQKRVGSVEDAMLDVID